MGLLDFLTNNEDKKRDDLFYEEGKALGMSDEEINEAKEMGLSPEEWLEEYDYENYLDQDLDE